MKKYIKITFSVLLSFSLLTSCDDFLEIEPEEVLLAVDYLGDDEAEARSALFGVLSQMQDLVAQYVVLGEMRGDLANANSTTEDEIRQINNLEISEDNSYIDPTTLFSIINNCNYGIVGIDTKAYDNRLQEDYASLLRIRTWAQLQILINYGKLPYITTPIRDDGSFSEEFEILDFNQGLDQLIRNLIPIGEIENVTRHENSLSFNIFKMIPDNDILLGDLYLWRGDNIGAAVSYKKFLDNDVNIGPEYTLDGSYDTNIQEDGTFGFTATTSWNLIFSESVRNDEVIDYIPFSEDFRQKNEAYDILTTQISPSASILANWRDQSWGFEGVAVEPNTGKIGDLRGIYSLDFGTQQQITKYQEDYFIWNRAAKVYLRYAEAINYAGYPEHALVALNGIFNNPNVAPQNSIILDETTNEKFLLFDKELYYTLDSNDNPTAGHLGVRGRAGLAPVGITYAELSEEERILRDHDVVREAFSNLSDVEFDNLSDDIIQDKINELELELRKEKTTNQVDQVGGLILNEAALELAFEGNRWEDLVRFSMRSGDKSIIANAVANKFETSGDLGRAATVKSFLNDTQDNWFLPLEVPDNFITRE